MNSRSRSTARSLFARWGCGKLFAGSLPGRFPSHRRMKICALAVVLAMSGGAAVLHGQIEVRIHGAGRIIDVEVFRIRGRDASFFGRELEVEAVHASLVELLQES